MLLLFLTLRDEFSLNITTSCKTGSKAQRPWAVCQWFLCLPGATERNFIVMIKPSHALVVYKVVFDMNKNFQSPLSLQTTTWLYYLIFYVESKSWRLCSSYRKLLESLITCMKQCSYLLGCHLTATSPTLAPFWKGFTHSVRTVKMADCGFHKHISCCCLVCDKRPFGG